MPRSSRELSNRLFRVGLPLWWGTRYNVLCTYEREDRPTTTTDRLSQTQNFQPKNAKNEQQKHLLKSRPDLRQRKFLGLCQLPEEDEPAWVTQPGRTPADLPEGDGGVCGGDVPPVDHLGLPQPLVRLGEGDEVALSAGLRVEMAKPGRRMGERVLCYLANKQNCCSSRLLV